MQWNRKVRVNHKNLNVKTSCYKRALTFLKEYSRKSSLHGLQYLGEDQRFLLERVWWVSALSLSLVGCSFMINSVWMKWNASPVMVSFSERPTAVWDIPFPAITVCSENKIRQSKFNYSRIQEKMFTGMSSAEESVKFGYLALWCSGMKLVPLERTYGNELFDFLYEVGYECSSTFPSCTWRGKSLNCCDYFFPIFTEEGLCFTFNMLSPDELYTPQVHRNINTTWVHSTGWSREGGYQTPCSSNMDYPWRTLSLGMSAGLGFILDITPRDMDVACTFDNSGFKILLHSPDSFPQIEQQFFRVPLQKSVVVVVRPKVMTTSQALLSYAPERRLCYFHSERPLRYFKIYTQVNCQLECLTNHSLELCGCVMFYMPRNSSTRICSYQKEACLNFLPGGVRRRGDTSYKKDGVNDLGLDCNCLPGCTEIDYDVEMSLSDHNWMDLLRCHHTNCSKFDETAFVNLAIFFKEMQFLSKQRNELYGQTDFLANCGGILSLFLGFSLLSGIEIVYFLPIRLLCNHIKQKREPIRMNLRKKRKHTQVIPFLP